MSPGVEAIRCPFCQSPTVRGVAMIHATMFGILLGSWAAPLFFRQDRGAEIKALRPNRSYCTYRCPQCQSLVIRAG